MSVKTRDEINQEYNKLCLQIGHLESQLYLRELQDDKLVAQRDEKFKELVELEVEMKVLDAAELNKLPDGVKV